MTEKTENDQEAVPPAASRSSSADSGGTDNAFDSSKRFALADLLRDCAVLVEQNEMDQKVFHKMFLELTAYVQYRDGAAKFAAGVPPPPARAAPAVAPAAATVNNITKTEEAPPVIPATAEAETTATKTSTAKSANARNPDPPGMSQHSPMPTGARKVTTTTTKHIPPPPSSTSSRSERAEDSALSKDKPYNLLGKIKNNVKEIGHEFTHIAHTGQRALSQAAKTATSQKNAQRVKADIAAELHGDEWCEEHFTMGCACKQKRSSVGGASDSRSTAGSVYGDSATRPANPSKPPFQRPVNPNSSLIANGWLEQQRRSKMRTVWKEVLVSLVAGRRPNEETTIWVQREIHNPITGAAGLEALHQIPIKGIQDVNYVDFSVDHRFVIQVYNLSDEFVFRTRDNGDAAKNWVSTLRLTREAILNGVPPPTAGDLQGASHRTKTYPGYSEDEKKAESPPQQHQQPHQQQADHPQPLTSRKLTVRDLRAIAHAHGVNTAGMERGELEAVVAKIQQQNGGRVTPHPPPGPPPPTAQKADSHGQAAPADEEEAYREAQRRAQEEQQREAERRAREERARQMKLDEETAARLAAEEVTEAERRRKQAEEERRRAEYVRQQEFLRQQQAQAAAQQKWQEDQRKAAAEAERMRQQQQYYAHQQAQWNQQHAHWNQQPPPQQQPGYAPHQQHPQQQQYQRPAGYPNPPPPGVHPHPPPPPGVHPHPGQPHPSQGPQPGPPPPGAGNTNKWVNMASEDQSDSGGQAKITKIKHDVLVKWALQPPNFQMLRSIEMLLTTIHTVFPPNLGVDGHDYFKKWKALSIEGLSENGRAEEGKLAKAVKKLRFFLHPDKLPRDLTEEQSFVCKMAWDITNDAWDEYEKRKHDLDWLHQS